MDPPPFQSYFPHIHAHKSSAAITSAIWFRWAIIGEHRLAAGPQEEMVRRLRQELLAARQESDRLQRQRQEKDALAKMLNVELLVQVSPSVYFCFAMCV